ncbi:growth hormone secretagogue receptor type 1 [Biomphalaria glabrata]|nr:growth hormone secretagogue receptor type 1 [Biomphalaria glabrata]
MNISIPKEISFENIQWILSEESTYLAMLILNVIIFGFVSFLGVLTNVVNMHIFVKMQLHDSMTVELFSLAMADFFIAALELGIVSMDIIVRLCPLTYIDLQTLGHVLFAMAVNAAYLISCWITVIISLERCLSVAYPFRVKQLFTIQRSCLAVLVVYVVHIVMFLPGFVLEKMEWVFTGPQVYNSSFSSASNRWIYTIVFSQATVQVETALRLGCSLSLFFISQSVLFICSIWMTVALKNSSRIRNKRQLIQDADHIKSQLTKKETKLIRMVLFLSFLHLVCNLPRLSLYVFYFAYPWSSAASQRNTLNIMWAISAVISNVTCFTSIGGYYHLNTKYRKLAQILFTRIVGL